MLKLQLLTGPRKGRKIRVSDDAPVTIGRTFGRIRLHDSRCSKNHAEIVFDGDSWIFRDLGSANGTHINKTRVSGLIELESGDMIQIGRILIKVNEANAWGVRSIGVASETPTARSAPPPKPIADEPVEAPSVKEKAATGETAFGDDLDLDALFEEFENDEDLAINALAPQANAPSISPASKPLKSDVNEETAAVDAITESASDNIVGLDDDPPAESDPDPDLESSPDQHESTADLIEIADDATDKPGTTMVLPNETIAASAVTDRASLVAPPETASPPMESQGPGEDSGVNSLKATAAPKDSADSGADSPDDEAIGLASDNPIVPQAPPARGVNDGPKPGPTSEDLSDRILIDDKRGETPIVPPQAIAEPKQVVEEADGPQTEAEVEPTAVVEAEEPVEESSVEAEAGDEPPQDATPPIEADVEAEPVPPILAQASGVDEAVTESAESASALINATAEGKNHAEEGACVPEAIVPVTEEAAPRTPCDEHEADEFEAEKSNAETPDNEQEDLAQSQLDVAFIQQALADLKPEEPTPADAADAVDEVVAEITAGSDAEANNPDTLIIEDSDRDNQTEVSSPDDTDYDAPTAQELSVPTGSSEAVADELDADNALEHQALRSAAELSTAFASPASQPPVAPLARQPLPGHNPVTIVASEEPLSSRGPTPAKRADRRRIFRTAALAAIFVGLGALVIHYINPNLANKITGRTTTSPPAEPGNTTPNASDLPNDQATPPSTPNISAPPETTSPGRTNVPPTPDDSTLDPADAIAGMPRQPDPFGAWPRVLGPRVLSGRTTDDRGVTLPENPDLDPLPQPNVQPDTPIILPNPGPPPPNLANPEQQATDTTAGTTADTTADTTAGTTTNQDPTAPADGDRLVFLVDCSGSLVDSLPQMLLWLDTATQNLAPGEQFTIIYFKNGSTQEILPTGFKPMSRSLREDLDARWLNPEAIPISPSGRSAPDQAMRLALSYEPSDVYLLSDEAFGRETGNTSQDQAVKTIADLIGDHEVRVHGVQFFYEDESGTLESIANQFGGTYEFIAETRHPDQPPIDLLEQLENRD